MSITWKGSDGESPRWVDSGGTGGQPGYRRSGWISVGPLLGTRYENRPFVRWLDVAGSGMSARNGGVGVKSLFDPDQTLDNARIPLAAHRRKRLSLSGIPWTQISGQSPKGVVGGAETGSS